MKIIGFIAFGIASLCYSQQSTTPITEERIAVNRLDAKGISADEADIITAKLRSELMAVAGYKIMERGKMNDILKEQGFQQTGACSEESCIMEMGQLLGVTHMIAGSVGKIGNSFSISPISSLISIPCDMSIS